MVICARSVKRKEVNGLPHTTKVVCIRPNVFMKYKIKDEEIEPIELITCPYCGVRLNRVGKGLLPTSCHECMHQRFTPKIMNVLEVIKNE